jgi:hypothetical protein
MSEGLSEEARQELKEIERYDDARTNREQSRKLREHLDGSLGGKTIVQIERMERVEEDHRPGWRFLVEE